MKLFRMVAIAALGLLCATFVSAPGQNSAAPSPSPSPGPTVRSTSNLVVLDVVVTDHGHPVDGLARDGFHIFEDGKEQTVKVFEEHRASEPHPAQAPPTLPPNTYSNFPELPASSAVNVLLLDAMNTPLQDQRYVRKQMIEYLDQIPAQSYMAIFTLGTRLRLVQGFTAHPGSLVAALQGSKQSPTGSLLLPGANDSTDVNVVNSATDLGAGAEEIDAIRQFQADTAVFQNDLRVRNTLEALNQMAGYLGTVPGRKNLIWLSGSFPISFDPDTSIDNSFSVQREYSTQIKETTDRLTAARVAVYPVDVRGLFTSDAPNAANRNPNYSGVAHGSSQSSIADPSASPGLGRGRRRAGRSPLPGRDVSDPNTFAADDAKFMKQTTAERATMNQIAEETGGVPFYEGNDIPDAVARAIENGTNYYTLAYSPEDRNLDGRFRKVRVVIAGKDYGLAYRRGYFADPHGIPALGSPLTPSSSSMQRGAPPSSQILFKVRVLAEDDPALKGLKSQPGRAGFLAAKLKGRVKRYWIDFAGDMHHVDFPLGSDGLHHGVVEFITAAYDPDGKLLNVVNRTFKLNLVPAQYGKVIQTGLPAHEELDIPGGEIHLRFAVHDLSTDQIGTVEIPLNVKVR